MSEEYKFQMKRFVRSISPSYVRKGYRYLKMHGVKQFVIRLGERFNERDMEYSTWFALNRATEEELERQRNMAFKCPVKISIAVPLYKTPEKFLRAMIESVMAQTYPFWELCMVDASPMLTPQKKTMLTDIIQEYMSEDERIRYQILESNGGISENMNRAVGMARGEFVGFLDHDDLLEPDALFEMAQMIFADETVDAVYTDEDKTDRRGKQFLTPNMKPDFNLDLLRSNNYICHFFIVRRRIAVSVGGFHSEFDGAQDYDFIFRCTEEARKVAHVHKVLYHWRTHEGSTSDNPNSKLYAFEAGKRAVQAHLERAGVEAEVFDTPDLGYYRVKYPVQGNPMVSILIPNKDQKETLEKCLTSLQEKTEYENYEILVIENNSKTQEIFDYYKEIDGRNHVRVLCWKDGFNFSAINNFAAKQAKGEYLVLLNNDTEIITRGWLKELLGTCQRPEVGMVGAKLYFPDDTVQSAGTIIGMGGLADHAFVNMPRVQSGYMHRASIQMDLSGVTAACAMVKKSVFEEVGGFEEELTVAFNDVDLGLKIVTAGYLIVFDPYAEVYHYESKSRGADDEQNDRHKREVRYTQEKWADFLAAGDPCYNKNLTLSKHNFSLRK